MFIHTIEDVVNVWNVLDLTTTAFLQFALKLSYLLSTICINDMIFSGTEYHLSIFLTPCSNWILKALIV